MIQGYAKVCRASKLVGELLAAVPSLAPVMQDTPTGHAPVQQVSVADLLEEGVRVYAPEDADWEAIAAVIAAHDASTPSQGEIDAAAEHAILTDLAGVAGDMLTRLQQIESAQAPTNAQVVAAIRDLATYQERTLRVLRLVVKRSVGA